MRDWHTFVKTHLRAAGVKPAREARLGGEIAAQLEDVYQDALAGGATEEEADRQAREHVGDWGQLAVDLAATERAGTIIEQFVRDLTFGTRVLGRDTGFTLMAILTLAVAIAANAAVFSLVHSVVLRPLAPDAGRLVTVYNSYPKAGLERAGNAVPDHFDRLAAVTAFEHQALFGPTFLTVGPAGNPERVRGIAGTPSLFRVLRAQAYRGRLFDEADGEVGQHHKTILSYAL